MAFFNYSPKVRIYQLNIPNLCTVCNTKFKEGYDDRRSILPGVPPSYVCAGCKNKAIKNAKLKDKGLKLKSVINFGKYNGYLLEEIIDENPSYVEWCVFKEIFVLSKEAQNYLEYNKD